MSKFRLFLKAISLGLSLALLYFHPAASAQGTWFYDARYGANNCSSSLFIGGSPFAIAQQWAQCNTSLNQPPGNGALSYTVYANDCINIASTTLTKTGVEECSYYSITVNADGSTSQSGPNGQYGLGGYQCAFLTELQITSGGTSCVSFYDKYFFKPFGSLCLPCIFGVDPNPPFGNPVFPQTGSKRQEIDLGFSIGGQPVTMTYDTLPKIPEASGHPTWLVPPPASFGSMWQSSLHKNWVLQSTGGVGAAYSSVAMNRGSASMETASVAGSNSCSGGGGSGGGTYTPTANPNEKVQLTGSGWAGTLFDAVGMTEELYDATGAITSLTRAAGSRQTFGYTTGLMTSVTDQFGRLVQFSYEQPTDAWLAKRINLITLPDGTVIHVGYDANNNLHTLTWPDGNVETLVYENTAFPWALTGIVDESGQRYSTYGYDAQGRAQSTYHGSGVEKYSVTYGTAPQWAVTETAASDYLCREHRLVAPQKTQITLPSNEVKVLNSGTANNLVVSTGQSQAAGSGSPATSTAMTYDALGNIASYDDLNGNRSCFAYDTTRGLPLITLEGLPGGASGKACPASLAGYAPSAVDAAHPERKTTTAWHPDWVLKAREAAPKKLTTWVYNGQSDPIAGGSASCAPTTATLPDGKPIAVLCARYEQATTDTTGAQGVSATTTGASRAWTYTYNQYGQVLTETTPKQSATDSLSHTTTYAYYPTSSFSGAVGHTMGDLQTITNPLGQVTTFTAYDMAGRLLSSIDPNGTVTATTYWPRGWAHTQTVTPASGSALTTTFDYWPTGLLKTVTMPDASTLNYGYDDAHRLTDVVDAAGNKVHYVLDNVGNRTSEQVSDASGNLAASVSRVFDALNRVQTQTGIEH